MPVYRVGFGPPIHWGSNNNVVRDIPVLRQVQVTHLKSFTHLNSHCASVLAMDAIDDFARESGYEASNEAVMRDSAELFGSDSINSNVSLNDLRNAHQESLEQTPLRRKASTPPSSADDRSLSSPTSPSSSQQCNERRQIRSQVGSTTVTDSDYSSSASSLELRQQPVRPYVRTIVTGKTAREVAERAQDEMLIRAGLQKPPSQLIKKTTRSDPDTEAAAMCPREYRGVCSHCRKKKVCIVPF